MKRLASMALLMATTLLLSGCSRWQGEPVGATAPSTELSTTAAPEENPLDIDLLRAMSAAGALTPLPEPPNLGLDEPLVKLGRRLFFDPILSGNRDLACASCHSPTHGTADPRPLSVGTSGLGATELPLTGRNAPALYNLAHRESAFWDGRVHRHEQRYRAAPDLDLPLDLRSTLAAQTMHTAVSRVEMRGQAGEVAADGQPNELAALPDDQLEAQWAALMRRLLAVPEYRRLLQAAYPDAATEELGFSAAANALAAFQIAEFRSGRSAFDRYVQGDDSALTEDQKRGGLLFYGRARCSGCHRGPLQTDHRFHNVGAPQLGPGFPPHEPLDLGRGGVTGKPEDRFRFRTPSLRNVELTPPYTHAGAYSTLRDVVEHYRNPTEALANYDASGLPELFRNQVRITDQLEAGGLNTLSPIAGAPLELSSEEVEQLVAFLHSLTDEDAAAAAEDRIP